MPAAKGNEILDCPDDAPVSVARRGVGRADAGIGVAGGAFATAAEIVAVGHRGVLTIDNFEMKSAFSIETKADQAEAVCESVCENFWNSEFAAVRKARAVSAIIEVI